MKRLIFTAAIMVAAIMALTSCTGSNNGEKLTTVKDHRQRLFPDRDRYAQAPLPHQARLQTHQGEI